MNKIRTRKMRGGAWYNPFSWGKPEDPNAPKKSWMDWWNSTTSSAENSLSSATTSISNSFSSTPTTSAIGSVSSSNESFNNYEPPQPAPQNMDVAPEGQGFQSFGGKKSRKLRKYRKNRRSCKRIGGSIADNAEQVSSTNTAKPTYWIKGGRRHRSKKNKRNHKK